MAMVSPSNKQLATKMHKNEFLHKSRLDKRSWDGAQKSIKN